MRNLLEVALVFLKLGTTAFGGPAAHIAMMEEEIVKRRKWVDRDQFMDLLGASNLIPGPNSTELAIHLGFRRAGWAGLIVAGACFIVPAMLLVWLLAYIYVRYESLPELSGMMYGIKPVIAAVVVQALWGLARTAVKNVPTAVAGIASLLLAMAGVNEIVLLLAAGAGVLIVANRNRLKKSDRGLPLLLPDAFPLFGTAQLAADPPYPQAAMSATALFLTFLKIGSVLYGSGYVLLAFLQSDFVERAAALSTRQLLDAVAVGQFTPGPVFTTATFVGYLIHGHVGAVVATIGIFLPAFVFVALINPWVPKLRKSPWMSGFLDGVNVASLSLMAHVSWQLGVTAIVDAISLSIALVSFLLLYKYKVNSAWLVLAGGTVGWLTGL